jgi:hypothetical protein
MGRSGRSGTEQPEADVRRSGAGLCRVKKGERTRPETERGEGRKMKEERASCGRKEDWVKGRGKHSFFFRNGG